MSSSRLSTRSWGPGFSFALYRPLGDMCAYGLAAGGLRDTGAVGQTDLAMAMLGDPSGVAEGLGSQACRGEDPGAI